MNPTRSVASLLLLAAATASIPPALAAGPRQTPDPRAILQRAADACAKVNLIEYEEVHVRADAPDSAPGLRATVRQQRATVPRVAFLPGRFRVEGAVESAGSTQMFGYSYDGQVLRVLDVKRKRVQVSRSTDAREAGRLLGGETGMVGMPQFTDESLLRSLLEKATAVNYEGRRTVAGAACDAVAVEQSISSPSIGVRTIRTVWYVGVDDGLPRGNAISGLEKQVRIIGVNGPAPADPYEIHRPPDYVEVAVTGKEADVEGLLPAGSVAPDWTLTDGDGHRHSLSELRGQIVLLDFWGTWCVPCLKSMPTIQALHERFGARGLRVFGVAVADNEGDPRGHMKRQGYTYTLLLDGDEVAKSYKAVMLPTLYLIGRDGRILHAERGFRADAAAELARLVDGWLSSRAPNLTTRPSRGLTLFLTPVSRSENLPFQ